MKITGGLRHWGPQAQGLKGAGGQKSWVEGCGGMWGTAPDTQHHLDMTST